MRYFIAVDTNDQIKNELINLQKGVAPFVVGKMVEPDNLHFTLKFLGEIDDRQAEGIKDTIAGLASQFQSFDAELIGLDAFPSKNYIKILWVGAPQLYNLQKTISDSLAEFEQDHQIIPHITIARVANVKDKGKLSEFMKMHEKQHFGTLNISNVKLKKSTLTQQGPIYEDIGVFELSA